MDLMKIIILVFRQLFSFQSVHTIKSLKWTGIHFVLLCKSRHPDKLMWKKPTTNHSQIIWVLLDLYRHNEE